MDSTNNAVNHTLQTFVWRASSRSYGVESTASQLKRLKIRSLSSCADISQTVEKCRTNVEESLKILLDP